MPDPTETTDNTPYLQPDPSLPDGLDAVRKALDANTAQGTAISGSPEQDFAHRYILSPLGKTLDVLDTDLNAVTNVLRPVFEGLNPQLKEVYDNAPKKFGMPNVVPSDLIEKSLEGTPGNKWLAKILGFAADVALSPTTYLFGIGTLTKEGQLFSKIKSLTEAGSKIAIDSPIAAEIAAHYGQEATPALIGKAVKEAKVFTTPTLEQQSQMGQRALINIGIPFTKTEIPLIKSDLFFRGIDQASAAFKESRFGKVFNSVFSTSSGNPVFDGIRSSFVGLGRAAAGDVTKFAENMGAAIDEGVKITGLPKDEFMKMINNIGETTYKGPDISADAVIQTFQTNIQKQIIDQVPIDKIINSLPGVDMMHMAERAKLANNLVDIAKQKQAGFDVFGTGWLQMPRDIRGAFAKEWSNGIGIKVAQDVVKDLGGKISAIKLVDWGRVLEAYNTGVKFKDGLKFEPGVDAALITAVGKPEYLRLKDLEDKFNKMSAAFAIPNHYGTEIGAARDTVIRMVAHIDQGFSTMYTLHQTNPDFLAKIAPKMGKFMKVIDSNPDWKIKSLIEQYHLDPELAKQYPQAFDLAQTRRAWTQNQLQLEAKVGTEQWVGDTSYIPHVPSKEVREYLQENNPNFVGGAKSWNMEHQSQLQRSLRNVDPRSVNEAINTGVLSNRQGKKILELAAQDGGKAVDYIDRLVSNKNVALSENAASQLFHSLTVDETALLAKNGKLRLLGYKPFDKFFEENPALQVMVRGVRGAKAITSADFYDAARQFGTPHPIDQALPDGMKFVKDTNSNPLGKTISTTVMENGKPVIKYSKLAFDEGVAKGIDAMHYSLKLPPGTHPILSTFDGLQAEWKAWTLALFPAYHTRNLIGNLWNNFLAGIHTPDPYLKALQVQAGKDIEIIAGNGEKFTGKQLARLAEEKGIVDTGQYTKDIEEQIRGDIETGIQGKISRAYQKARIPVDYGLKWGSRIENNAKMALFIHRIEEGYSLDKAAMDVKKYLFDYGDLTDFEKNFMKRVFPFYSWSRKNIPLQLEALLTTPARMMSIAKVRNAMETNYDGVPNERLLPDYMVQNFPIRTGYDPKTKQFQYFLLGSWLPAADIDKIFDPAQWVKNQLTPLLKEPAQQMANRDFYTGNEIDKGDQYQRISILGKNLSFNLPAREAHMLKNVRLISELDKLSSPDLNPMAKIVRAGTGKLYPFDEQKQRVQEFDQYKARRQNLLQMLKQDRKQGNTTDAERILKTLQKLPAERAAKLQ